MKKTISCILIVITILLFVPLIWRIIYLANYINTIALYAPFTNLNSDYPYISHTLYSSIVGIEVFSILIILAAIAFNIFLLIHLNRNELKSVSIDFKSRREEKQRLKDKAKKEKLQKQLDELNKDGK